MASSYRRRLASAALLLATSASAPLEVAGLSSYANITLLSPNNDLSVVVYLPEGIKPDEPTYYKSSRFEHGSMIGQIIRKTHHTDGTKEQHLLYGNDRWRTPHNSYWPESGVGLASEFGVGDDGSFCNFQCGWDGVNDVTNGVLGYLGARNGESFLKIGVGELLKGSCITCDSTDEYKFNSPYRFAKMPEWSLETQNPAWDQPQQALTLSHIAWLNENGYSIKKDIWITNDQLQVKTTLVNLGRVPFATAWYSHHFFTCDSRQIDVGYAVDLDVTETQGRYEEPGTWSWATPLQSYTTVRAFPEQVSIDVNRKLGNDIRIKAEFVKDPTSEGTFTLHGCGNSIREEIPEVGTKGGVSMYAFNLYLESDTLSPEPQILIRLNPGQSTSWTQRLTFSDFTGRPSGKGKPALGPMQIMVDLSDGSEQTVRSPSVAFLLFIVVSTGIALVTQRLWGRYRPRREGFTQIPDQAEL